MKSSGNGNNQADLYFIHRLDEIRGQKMYPFFDKGGNDNNGDFQLNIRDTQPQINKQLNFLLPFYGFGFNYTWLSLHGYLSFSESPVQVHSVYEKRCKIDVSWSQPIKLVQVASTSELLENQRNDLVFFKIIPSHFCRASEASKIDCFKS